MKKKKFEKISNKMINVGISLNELESLSRILTNSLRFDSNLKIWDAENLSSVISKKIIRTKQKFNTIEELMKI